MIQSVIAEASSNSLVPNDASVIYRTLVAPEGAMKSVIFILVYQLASTDLFTFCKPLDKQLKVFASSNVLLNCFRHTGRLLLTNMLMVQKVLILRNE